MDDRLETIRENAEHAGDLYRRAIRRGDHEFKRREFRHRQQMLGGGALLYVVLYALTGNPVVVGLAALFLQVATDEARRFRRTGTTLQTRRSIWKGTTPIDVASRRLLDGWTYPGASR